MSQVRAGQAGSVNNSASFHLSALPVCVDFVLQLVVRWLQMLWPWHSEMMLSRRRRLKSREYFPRHLLVDFLSNITGQSLVSCPSLDHICKGGKTRISFSQREEMPGNAYRASGRRNRFLSQIRFPLGWNRGVRMLGGQPSISCRSSRSGTKYTLECWL